MIFWAHITHSWNKKISLSSIGLATLTNNCVSNRWATVVAVAESDGDPDGRSVGEYVGS